MVVATAGESGRPSSRVVLLRGFDEQGFVFYTNYESQKGREIDKNPDASLLFFWPALERQIRIEGRISKTSRAESEAYFATRPRESQIGAWASAQSRVIESRGELEAQIAEIEKRFAGKEIICPAFWGGFRLAPAALEFWQGRKSRLHDRLAYTRAASGWKIERLSP
jgi:pyridoxamine 5'-phosphate oxidase